MAPAGNTLEVLLVVDHQVGLYSYVRDMEPNQFHNAIITHAALAKLFDIPCIMTTSTETGPNGPIPKEIIEMHPNAPLIKRDGEISAWDSQEFRDTLKATGRTHVILAGIATDVCTTFLALALREEGYSVWANVEASGTNSAIVRDAANAQMRDAGVHVVSVLAIIGDLWRHWRNFPEAQKMVPFMAKYLPTSSYVFRSHAAAAINPVVFPGEKDIL